VASLGNAYFYCCHVTTERQPNICQSV